MTTENNKKPSDAALRAANTIAETHAIHRCNVRAMAKTIDEAMARNIDGAWNEMASALDTPTNPIKPGGVVTLAIPGCHVQMVVAEVDDMWTWAYEPTADGIKVHRLMTTALRKVDPEPRASSDNAPYVYDDTVATRALNSLVDFLWDMFPNEKTAMGKDGAAAVAIRLLSDQQPMDEETHRHIYDVVKEWTKAWDDEPRASILQNWLDGKPPAPSQEMDDETRAALRTAAHEWLREEKRRTIKRGRVDAIIRRWLDAQGGE